MPRSSYRKLDPLGHDNAELLKIMSEDWQRSDDHYESVLSDACKDWERYLLIKKAETLPTPGESSSYDPEESARSDLKRPTMRKHIDTAASLIMASLIPDNAEWLHAKPVSTYTGEDATAVLNDIEIYRQFRLDMLSAEHMDFYGEIEAFIRQGLIFPWSLITMNWHRLGGWVRRQLPENDVTAGLELVEHLKKMRTKRVYDPDLFYEWNDTALADRANLQVLHTANTRPDPRGGRLLRNLAYLMDEVRVPWHELYANEWNPDTNEGIYFNLDELEETVSTDDSSQTQEEEMRQSIGEADRQGTAGQDEFKERESFRNTVILRRYWTQWGVACADKSFHVMTSKRRYEKMPFWDFKATIDWTKFDAQSFARLLREADETNDMLLNFRLTNLSFGIDGIVTSVEGAMTEASKGKPIHPGAHLMLNIDDVRKGMNVLRTSDVTYRTGEDMAITDRDAEAVIGQSENQLGTYFSQGRRLATEVQTVAAAGANRGGQLTQRVERSVLTPMLNYMTRLEADRLTREYDVTVAESGNYAFPRITPEFVKRMENKIRFVARGSLYVNQKEIERASAMNAANVIMNNQVLAQPIDPIAMDEWILRRVGNETNPEHLFLPEAQEKTTIPPEVEWLLIRDHGANPEPHFYDDDSEHLAAHQMQRERAMMAFAAGTVTEDTIQRLEEHITKTQQAIAKKQTGRQAPAPGPVTSVLPGQEGSQDTAGTQAANIGNVQLQGVMPPREEVTQ